MRNGEVDLLGFSGSAAVRIPEIHFLFSTAISLFSSLEHKGLWRLNADWLNGDGVKDWLWLRLRHAKGD